MLKHVWLAIEITNVFTLSQIGIDSGWRVKSWDASAPGAAALNQNTLRYEFNIKRAGCDSFFALGLHAGSD